MVENIITIKNLKKYFPLRTGLLATIFGEKQEYVRAVDGISFDVKEREFFGLAGESGSGKTTTGRLIAKLVDPTEGHIYFRNEDIAYIKRRKKLKKFRKEIQMIFQDPYESLNPRLTVSSTIAEPLVIQKLGSAEERERKVIKSLEFVELKPPEDFLDRHPHELSGGQRQRIAVARALVVEPSFLVADEPVSMLDASIRTGVMELFHSLKEKLNLSCLFITHDLACERYMSDRLGVMYLGKIVESGKTEEIVRAPSHPYTRALVSTVPVPDPTIKKQKSEIKGEIPSPIHIPKGCRFHPRCPYAKGVCKEKEPPLKEVSYQHLVACHL